MSDTDCSAKLGGPDVYRTLRIVSLFVILLSSGIGAFFPLIAKRSLQLPGSVFEFAKYFGSGVIIATAFIHLLSPAFEELGSECLGEIWKVYPWPAAISLSSVFFIFFIELFAFRWGTARIKKLNAQIGEEGGFKYDTHGHALEGGSHAAHGPEGVPSATAAAAAAVGGHVHDDKHDGHSHQHGHGHEGHSHQAHSHSHAGHSHQPGGGGGVGVGGEGKPLAESSSSLGQGSLGHGHGHGHGMMVSPLSTHPLGQYVSILILESGIIFHSFIIGLTLAVSEGFIPLFIVVVFHQLFEGLGLGTRLSQLLPARHCHHLTDVEKAQDELLPAQNQNANPQSKKMQMFPYLGAVAFALTTPLGIAIGLGLQTTYDPGSNTANIVSGVLDAFSSGILMYTGLVELLAHEFLFSPQMMERPLWGSKGVLLAGAEVLMGAGLMSLLGRWA